MQELEKQAKELQDSVESACTQINLPELKKRLANLSRQMKSSDFWVDNQKAQTITKEHAALEARLQPWQKLAKEAHELNELVHLGDAGLKDDLIKQLQKLTEQFDELKTEQQFSGPYDEKNTILEIHAGAGGTDAQDWAQMLFRMYVRWAETHNYNVKTVEQSTGEEAGIKSATLEIDGPFAYGKLKGEHGVHRLVRLSPFNADHLRQTSFAKVAILPVIDKPDDLAIDDKDLKVDVYRSGGHGGQSVNTTDSAVRITHIPTAITVAIQNERSQLQNKETALTILRSRLAQLQLEQHKEKLAELKGPNQSAEWGNQIRSYVLHPYKQVKDLRTKHESSDPDKVLDGDLDSFIKAYLEANLQSA
jgi:peptide chain release factor 2